MLSVSVIVACYNEQRVIRQRIENLLELDYPPDKLEIIIASDGSTDQTAKIAQDYADRGVMVLKLGRGGRALTHNEAVTQSRGDIIVFSDADVEFDSSFVRNVVRYFLEDEMVGCVVGNLRWKNIRTGTARFRELTWKFEVDLKETESRLGILASASGPAMAVRKMLWKPMVDAIDDVDSITPLDVILQRHSVVFARDAVGYDAPFLSPLSDFKSKVRGVSKSIVTIPRRWTTRQWLHHPLVAWRTISHHVLRWVAPYIMVVAFLSSICLLERGALYRGMFLFEVVCIVLVLIGSFGEYTKRRVSIASLLFNFAVVNAGFAVGLIKGMVGAARGEYETE